MNYLNKILLLSLFFIPSFFIHAESVKTLNSTQSVISCSGDYSTYQDCIQSQVYSNITLQISQDREFITYYGPILAGYNEYDTNGNASHGASELETFVYQLANQSGDPYTDGNWNTYLYTTNGDTYWFSFYTVNGKIYFDLNDIPTVVAPSVEVTTGNVEFGIAIIITLLCLGFVGFIYNKTSKKRPWK